MIRFETFDSLEFDLVLMQIIFVLSAWRDYIQFELLTYLMYYISITTSDKTPQNTLQDK